MTENFGSKTFNLIIFINVVSVLIMFVSLLTLGLINDYGFYEVDKTLISLNNSGIIPTYVLSSSETIFTTYTKLPKYLDYFWLVGFLSLIISLFYNSYNSKRVGYFNTLSLLTFGVMAVLFLSSIYVQLSDWLVSNLFPVLGSLSNQTPFFTFYITHYGTINMIIVFVSILLNFIDFDFTKFNTRKSKETTTEEL